MLKNKTILGIAWSFGEQLLQRGTSVFVTLLLAYFLVPEDYGLIAILSLFLTLGGALVESGFKQALIRKETITDIDLNTAFYSNIFFSIIAYVTLYSISPLVSEYYNESKIELLIKISAILLIFNSFHIVQSALLTKKLQFKNLLKASFPAALLSGFSAVLLAYFQFGVWALIVQMLFYSFLLGIFLWVQSSWRPSLSFSLASLKEMYTYGYKLFLSSLLNIFYNNIFVIIIAKTFTVGLAGLYFFADRIKELLVGQLISSIQVVTFPALSLIQNDSIRLKNAYKNIMQLMTFIVFPILLVFISVSELLFQIFLPEKWLPAVPYLQLMCVTSLVIPIISINLNIIKVKGRSDWYLFLELLKKITGVIFLFFTFDKGVIAILAGQILSQLLNYYPSVYFSNKLVSYSFFEQTKDFIPNLLLALTIAVAAYLLQSVIHYSLFLKLSIILFLSAFSFFLIAYTFKMKSLFLFISTTKEFLGKRKTNILSEGK